MFSCFLAVALVVKKVMVLTFVKVEISYPRSSINSSLSSITISSRSKSSSSRSNSSSRSSSRINSSSSNDSRSSKSSSSSREFGGGGVSSSCRGSESFSSFYNCIIICVHVAIFFYNLFC